MGVLNLILQQVNEVVEAGSTLTATKERQNLDQSIFTIEDFFSKIMINQY